MEKSEKRRDFDSSVQKQLEDFVRKINRKEY